MSSPYWNPTHRWIESGSFTKIPAFLEPLHPKTILLILGKKSFRSSPYFSKLQGMLAPYQLIESGPVPPNPKQDFIQEEINRLKNKPFDLVLAIGGGSVLDLAKILASIPRQEETHLEEYLKGKFELKKPAVPLIAVPTTAGTGSEVTPYASLETKDRKKMTISHPAFYPTVALIDPELCCSMPAYVTASTGFDALSQAIESFWSVHATPFSRTHSLRALELIISNFRKVLKNPKDTEARFAMSLASCEAGLAISQTKTTAVHSVSYPITTHFGIAHGHACALTLAPFVRFNAPVLKEEGKPLMARFGAADYEGMAREIEDLMEVMGLERSLSKLGIDDKGIGLIVRDGFRPDRVKNNPRPLSTENLQEILQSIR